MAAHAFPEIQKIVFEGPDSKNPLAFKHYDAEALVEGKSMREHLRFACAYWHTMRNPLADPFGVGTAKMPWDDGSDSVENAIARVDVFFEFLEKCDIDYYCFHDRDVSPEGADLETTEQNLDRVGEALLKAQKQSGKKLLWGTACLFIHPRYMHGAATSCSLDAYAWGGAQVRHAMNWTHKLGGQGYVFWGGREGYATLINTDMKREREHLARFFHMAVDHKKNIGFEGSFFIEPKPKEPTTHQYDSDAAACLNFLREFDLLDHFKLNLETNHAALAGNTMRHELKVAIDADALGSIDANLGTPNLGWDTDCFPVDLYDAAWVMHEVLDIGGLTTGGLNFDSKRRRESFDPIDLFHAHIAGMDTYARGLKIAAALRADGRIQAFIDQRYRSWNSELGKRVEGGETTFDDLREHALASGEPVIESGRQEVLEAIINDMI
ncbi:MAG: xylose isomerase [Phycisphaerales bacterium]|nr:xylose isomerase [Phycisphaerales bacterium]